jgi:hypothetical protein
LTRIQPPAFSGEIFGLTMKGLEAGLKVGDIATYELQSCNTDDSVADVLSHGQYAEFDRIPVSEEGRIVGLILRGQDQVDGPASDHMHRLDEGMLVSADEPLKGFIPLLLVSPFRLVVRGARIAGIVTQSDVHKLPVRLLAFALVTHLEMTMADVIVHRWGVDGWTVFLTPGRKDNLWTKFAKLRNENFDPPLIEVSDFCDKREILAKNGLLTVPSRRKARECLEQIEELRNSVAHGATYAQNEVQLREFVHLLEEAEAWIGRLAASPRPHET